MSYAKKDIHDRIKFYRHHLQTVQAFEDVQSKLQRLNRRLLLEELAQSRPPSSRTPEVSRLANSLAAVIVVWIFGFLALTGLSSTPSATETRPSDGTGLAIQTAVTAQPTPFVTTVNSLSECIPHCQGRNLNWQTVSGVTLHGVDLREALLIGTDLRACDLSGADLRGAQYNHETQWPHGFDPVAAGAIFFR